MSKIKCVCGCEYYPQDYNGCPQCRKGEVKFENANTNTK